MRMIILVAGLGLSLVACNNAATTTVDNSVMAAEIALTDAEKLALVYTRLPRCPAVTVCSDPATVARIQSLDNTAYNAVKAAESNASLLGAALSAIQLLRGAIPATPAS